MTDRHIRPDYPVSVFDTGGTLKTVPLLW